MERRGYVRRPPRGASLRGDVSLSTCRHVQGTDSPCFSSKNSVAQFRWILWILPRWRFSTRGPEQIENENIFLKLVDISDTSSDSSGTHLLALCVEKCVMSPGGVFLTAPGGLVLKGCAGGVSDRGGLSTLLLNVG